MFGFFFAITTRSKMLLNYTGNDLYGHQLGYADLRYFYNGESIATTFYQSGIKVQINVDGNTYKPANLSKELYGQLAFEMDIDSLTDNDGYLLFIIQNKNTTHPKMFSLGAYMNIAFPNEMPDNTITPLDSKPETGGVSPGIFTYYIEADWSTTQDMFKGNKTDWMKMVFDHLPFAESFTSKGYIKPDRFWYGNKNEGKDNFFQQIDNKNKVKIRDESHKMDLSTCFSWNNISIPANETKILATHIYFIMQKPLDIMSEKQLVAHGINEDIKIPLWMRFTNNNTKYDFGCISNSTTPGDDKQITENVNIKWANDRAIIYMPKKSDEGDYYYKCYIQEHGNTSTRSNEIIVHATVSTPPELTFNSQYNPKDNEIYNQTDAIILNYSLTGSDNVTLYADCYMRDSEYKIDSISQLVQTGSDTRKTGISGIITFNLSKIQSSGQYTLKVYAKNKFQNPSKPYPYNFIMDWSTYIQDLNVQPLKLAPGDAFNITGKFKDQDLAQRITFSTNVGQEIKSVEYTPSGDYDTFIINGRVPESYSTEGNQTFELIAKDSTGKIVYKGNYNLSINKKPVINFTPLKNKSNGMYEYTSDESLQLNVTVSDLGGGRITYRIVNTDVSGEIGYNPSSGSTQGIILAVNLKDVPYKKDEYEIEINAVDNFGLHADNKNFSFVIRNKPNIDKIENFPDRITPDQSIIQFNLSYTDKDSGKKLYLYAFVDNSKSPEKIKGDLSSFGDSRSALIDLNIRLSSGTHNYVFYLSDADNSDFASLSPSSVSNNITKTVHISKPPQFKIDYTRHAIYAGVGEKIYFNFSINDDGNGKIGYSLDDRTDFDTTGLKTSYTANGTDWTPIINNYFVVPEWCKYNKGGHILKIFVTDFYDMKGDNSKESGIGVTFYVKNKPNIVDIKSNATKLKSDTEELRTVQLTVTFKDLDKDKTLYFRVNESENENQYPLHHCNSTGSSEYQTQSFNYVVKTKESTENLMLIVWIADDTYQSNTKNITVSITESPSIESECPKGPYGLNDEINISYSVIDDGSGHVSFWLDDEKIINDIPYNTNQNKRSVLYNQTLKINKSLILGEHSISYYPIDSFGIETPLNKRKVCNFTFKSKPKLNDVKLNATQIDDDETVIVNGTLEDFDNGKNLYIFQQIDTQIPILIGDAVSNGATQYFEFPLKNLVSQPSGHKEISIFVADTNTTDSFDANSRSESAKIPLTFVNDPMFTVEVPNGRIYRINEEFPVIVNITTDLPCTLTIMWQISWLSYNSTTINFSQPTVYKNNFSIQYKGYYSYEVITFTLSGPNFTNLTHYEYLYVRNPIEIQYISPNSTAAKPGGLRFKFYLNDTEQTPLYFVACYKNNNSEIINIASSYRYGWSEYYYEPQFQINIDAEKKVNVTFWVQYTNNVTYPPERYLRSVNNITATVLLSAPPKIDVDFPENTYFSSDQNVRVKVGVEDEGSFNISVFIDNTKVNETGPYDKKFEGNIEFKTNASYKSIFWWLDGPSLHTMKISVTDQHGFTSYRTNSFYTLNPPKIKELHLKSEIFTEFSEIEGNLTFNDKDETKPLYLFYEVGPTIIPISDAIKSNGSDNQFYKFKFVHPKFIDKVINGKFFLSSEKTIDAYVKDDGSFIDDLMFSEKIDKTLTKTFQPSISIDPLPKLYYHPNETLRLTGKIAADGLAQISIYVGNENLKNHIFTNLGIEPSNFNLDFKLNLNYTKLPYRLSIVCISNGYYDIKTIYLHVMSEVKINQVTPDKDVYPFGQKFTANLTFNNQDYQRRYYVYYRVNGQSAKRMSRSVTADIGNNTIKFVIDDDDELQIGDNKIEIALSSTRIDISVIESSPRFSNIFTTTFKVSPQPIVQANVELKSYYKYGDEVVLNILMFDDEDVMVNYYFNGQLVDSENISLYGATFNGQRSLTIPNNARYGYNSLQFDVVDNFGFSRSLKTDKIFVINKPILKSIEFSKPFGIRGKDITLSGTFIDLDQYKQIYFFVQFGDKKPSKHVAVKTSEGGYNNQSFMFGITIDNDVPYGTNDVKVWIQSYDDHAVISSYPQMTKLDVTFEPSMTVTKPTKTVYQDGDKITIAGEVTSFTNVNLKYSIDNTKLNEVSSVKIDNTPQQFKFSIAIPEGFKQGQYTFSVYAVDSHGLETSSTKFEFSIQNPPNFIGANVVNEIVKQGEILHVRATVRDADAGDDINVYYSFDTAEPTVLMTLRSNGKDMSYTFPISIPNDMAIGDHTISLFLEDPEKMKSAPFILGFSVRSAIDNYPSGGNQTTNKIIDGSTSNRQSIAGNWLYIAIGVAAFVLLVLIVLLTILLVKKKNPSPPREESPSTGSDLEERETQISQNTAATVNMDEVATRDNPLFNSREITHDNDPFSDEFEEQDAM